MSTVNVQLPDSTMAFVKNSAEQFGLSSPAEYISAVLQRAEDARRSIEGELLNGIDSGPAEAWTEDDWAAVRGMKQSSTEE